MKLLIIRNRANKKMCALGTVLACCRLPLCTVQNKSQLGLIWRLDGATLRWIGSFCHGPLLSNIITCHFRFLLPPAHRQSGPSPDPRSYVVELSKVQNIIQRNPPSFITHRNKISTSYQQRRHEQCPSNY